jgi:hypothetical protein
VSYLLAEDEEESKKARHGFVQERLEIAVSTRPPLVVVFSVSFWRVTTRTNSVALSCFFLLRQKGGASTAFFALSCFGALSFLSLA